MRLQNQTPNGNICNQNTAWEWLHVGGRWPVSLVGPGRTHPGRAGFSEYSVLISIGPRMQTGAKSYRGAAARYIPRTGGKRGRIDRLASKLGRNYTTR